MVAGQSPTCNSLGDQPGQSISSTLSGGEAIALGAKLFGIGSHRLNERLALKCGKLALEEDLALEPCETQGPIRVGPPFPIFGCARTQVVNGGRHGDLDPDCVERGRPRQQPAHDVFLLLDGEDAGGPFCDEGRFDRKAASTDRSCGIRKPSQEHPQSQGARRPVRVPPRCRQGRTDTGGGDVVDMSGVDPSRSFDGQNLSRTRKGDEIVRQDRRCTHIARQGRVDKSRYRLQEP